MHYHHLKRVLFIILIMAASYPSYANMKKVSIAPARIVWMSDTTGTLISNAGKLLEPFSGQVSVNDAQNSTILKSSQSGQSSILLDFGKEIHGGIKIYTGMSGDHSAKKIRVCFGESASEAMSDIYNPNRNKGASNEHSIRDYILELPWLGNVECGNTGFRFVRIDALDYNEPIHLRYVEAKQSITDYPQLGYFECSDSTLNEVWRVGAYTVQLNMQDYLWDGIKRDRLVWVGDMHPEVMTILSVWGNHPVVQKSLDFAMADTPLPGWMNNMCSYSLWWLIIQRDLYLYTGDLEYIKKHQSYINGLVKQISKDIDADGHESLSRGERFLDWPTSRFSEIINSGLHSLTIIALNAAIQISDYIGDNDTYNIADKCLQRMSDVKVDTYENKQAAALAILSNASKNKKRDSHIVSKNGAENFTTFYGYYMLEALADAGMYKEAISIIKDYWGAMLKLGATTFWEDFDYSVMDKASRIDEIVPTGHYDTHADGGDYCYKGLRMSLCHGWASGPTAWLSRHVLGVKPLDPGCTRMEICPNLGDLDWVKGSFPTPKGPVKIHVSKGKKNKLNCNIDAPAGITIIYHEKEL